MSSKPGTRLPIYRGGVSGNSYFMTMATKRPTTIPEYLQAAPAAGQAHLQRLYALLKEIAPHAEETLKWNTPFFVEPRFVFAFSAHKAHLNFTTDVEALEVFAKELAGNKLTKASLQVRYADPFPEALIRKLAKYRVKTVKARKTDDFW